MKKNLVLAAVFATTSLVAAGASADPVGVNLGLRAGYALALGESQKDSPLSDAIKGAIPLQLDATFSVTKEVNVGLYFGYGLGMKGDKTTADSASTMAYGLQANMAFPSGDMAPWAGVFGGLESATLKGKVQNTDVTSSTSGWQAGLQGGADWKVANGLTAGPFASFAMGQFGSVKAEGGGQTIEGDVKDKAMHQWLTLGVRGTFGL